MLAKFTTFREKRPVRRYRIRAIVITGVVCAFAIGWTPVRAQEAEGGEAAVEQVEIPTDVDPNAAITIENPDIPVEDLQLLIKPLTLEELENEAIAWLGLLKAKATEISEAEIAIKRQNRTIDKEQEAADRLESAKQALKEAEEVQENAAPGSPEYEEAAKKIEEAKENIKEAQAAIEEAAEAERELQEDAASVEALKKAEEVGELQKAEQVLEEAKKARDEMTPGSLSYESATERIDALDTAILDFEDAKEAQQGTIPDSPEYEEATRELDAAREALKQAREAIDGPDTSDEQSSVNLDELSATIDNTEVEAGTDSTVAGPPEVGDAEGELDRQEQQLEQDAEKLEEKAEAEAEQKNQLIVAVTELQAEQTALIDRLNVILDALEAKGGDPSFYRKYIQSVGGVELDLQDTEGLGLRLISWFQSEEGGLRWLNNTGKFLGVFIGIAIGSQLVGIVAGQALYRIGHVSKLLTQFVVMAIRRGGVVLGFLVGLTALGVSLGPILALVGGVSFVLAFALQSNLGNLASGLMIMAYKPFDVGDEIKVNGLWGNVASIDLASTRIIGFDEQLFSVPNNTIWSSTIENLTIKENRMGVVPVRVSFNTNLRRVEQIWLEIASANPLTLDDPGPFVVPFKTSEYYADMLLKFWTKTEDWWTAYFDLIYALQERLVEEGISIVPQHEIFLPGSMPKLNSQEPLERKLSKHHANTVTDVERSLEAKVEQGN